MVDIFRLNYHVLGLFLYRANINLLTVFGENVPVPQFEGMCCKNIIIGSKLAVFIA